MRNIFKIRMVVLIIALVSCSSIPKDTNQNYMTIDILIQNPDTLSVLGRDTLNYLKPNPHLVFLDISESNINWFKNIANCLKNYGYKIIDEDYYQLKDNFKVHKVQIQCKKNDMKATFIFENSKMKKSIWRLYEVTPRGIWELPNDSVTP